MTVLADLVRSGRARLRPTALRWALALLVVPLLNGLVWYEERTQPSTFVGNHIAGYFITAIKQD